MALGDVFTQQQIDEEIDKQLPGVNAGKSLPIPRALAKAILIAENLGDKGTVTYANSRSPKQATGVGQVIPSTIRGLKKNGMLPGDFPEDLTTAPLGQQIQAHLAALGEFVTRRKTTDPVKIAALYNAGDGGAGKFLASNNPADLPKETQGYLNKVATGYKMQNIEMPVAPVPPTPATVQPSAAFSLTPLASVDYNNLSAQIPGIMAGIFGARDAEKAAGVAQSAAILQAGAAAGDAAKLQTESLLANEAAHKQILSSFGLDVADPANRLQQELAISARARADREKTGQRLTELQGKSLFADPLGWMQAIIEMPQVVSQYNNLVSMENTADSNLQKLQSLGNSVKSLTAANSADLLRAKAAKDAENFAASAQAQAAGITAKNAAGDAKALLDGWNLQQQNFSMLKNMEQFDVTKQMQLDARAERADVARERKDAQLADSTLLTGINTYRKMIAGNVPDFTYDDLKRTPALRAAWAPVISRGGFGDYQTTIAFLGEYGNEVGAAEAGNAGMMQQVRNIKATATKAAEQLMTEHNSKNPLNRLDYKRALEQTYANMFEMEQRYSQPGYDKSNLPATSPYAIDFNAVAAAARGNPEASKWLVAQIAMRERERNPGKNLNEIMSPRYVVDAVRAEVLAGKADPTSASVQLSNFYKSAETQQYVTGGLRYLGLKAFTDYTITPGMAGEKQIDLYNTAMIENYLTSEVAKTRRGESGSGFLYDMFLGPGSIVDAVKGVGTGVKNNVMGQQ